MQNLLLELKCKKKIQNKCKDTFVKTKNDFFMKSAKVKIIFMKIAKSWIYC